MKTAVKRKSAKHSADRLMRNVAITLIRDFRNLLDDPTLCSSHYEGIINSDIERIRSTGPALNVHEDNPTRLKVEYQIGSLFKRYRFQKDLFSDQQLRDLSIEKFMDVQDRVFAHSLNSISAFSDKVLRGAQTYISKVLGVYSDEEHRDLCRFGRRASVGVPARKACEAQRWELPITGSCEQISWFDSEMSRIDSVQEYWLNQKMQDPKRSVYREVRSLKLTLVPKTFKSLRIIMPNTTIGSYMSYGLGEMIRLRLRRVGYNISSLQMRHRLLAQRGSVHSLYTTADLSSASDTISVELVRRLFPTDWYNILEKSRIGTVELPDGHRIESETFCTMGIGYTFPLQTLVFLSLLKSLSFCLYGPKSYSTISVYGDDMIYPSSMHKDVVRLFEDLGFIINLDKTYDEGWFRESCGGDYFRGVDVRPFQPQNGPAFVTPKAYEAVLYKYVNGLLARWSEYEIPETLSYLMSEIGSIAGAAKVVPCDFPDDSGIKCPTLGHWQFLCQRSDVAHPKHIGHGIYRFSYLRLRADGKEERRHEPYLWLALRGLRLDPTTYGSGPSFPRPHSNIQLRIDRLVGIDEGESSLTWVKEQDLSRYGLKPKSRRLRRLVSLVMISHTGRYKRQIGFSCFEDRRP